MKNNKKKNTKFTSRDRTKELNGKRHHNCHDFSFYLFCLLFNVISRRSLCTIACICWCKSPFPVRSWDWLGGDWACRDGGIYSEQWPVASTNRCHHRRSMNWIRRLGHRGHCRHCSFWSDTDLCCLGMCGWNHLQFLKIH